MVDYKYIVKLWYETQMGNIHKCREKQLEFSEYMWALYEDLQPEIFDEKIVNLEPMLKRILEDKEHE